mmetsp:Transcript_10410/g.34732  ORF Transcript_10410/g.34732 Transcript_10410/m.34732 type:complete len:208 (+) Transcript_10410:1670-2293(+)
MQLVRGVGAVLDLAVEEDVAVVEVGGALEVDHEALLDHAHKALPQGSEEVGGDGEDSISLVHQVLEEMVVQLQLLEQALHSQVRPSLSILLYPLLYPRLDVCQDRKHLSRLSSSLLLPVLQAARAPHLPPQPRCLALPPSPAASDCIFAPSSQPFLEHGERLRLSSPPHPHPRPPLPSLLPLAATDSNAPVPRGHPAGRGGGGASDG